MANKEALRELQQRLAELVTDGLPTPTDVITAENGDPSHATTASCGAPAPSIASEAMNQIRPSNSMKYGIKMMGKKIIVQVI